MERNEDTEPTVAVIVASRPDAVPDSRFTRARALRPINYRDFSEVVLDGEE